MKIVHSSSNYKLGTLLFLLFFSLSSTNYKTLAAPEKKEISVITLSSHPEDGKAYAWQMMRVNEVDAGGAEISQYQFNTKSWQPAIVPGTALNSLVENGEFPEPYFGKTTNESTN